jgi:glycosyltransferase involved in cell wall biosynthesis
MPVQTPADIAVLIPAYQPDKRLGPYVEQLAQAGVKQIVVVDDGSGPDYDDVFGVLEQYREAALLRYPVNRGKGYALRYGMEYIQKSYPDCRFVVTADSDGQHTVTDILRMTDALREDSFCSVRVIFPGRTYLQKAVWATGSPAGYSRRSTAVRSAIRKRDCADLRSG